MPEGRTGRQRSLVARDRCPVCASPGAPFLVLRYDEEPLRSYLERFYAGALDVGPLEGERYELVDCGDCGLVYQRNAPDERYLEHLYGAAAAHDVDEENRVRGLAVRRRYSFDVEQCVKHFGGDPSKVDVLDHGAGAGLWLDMAAAYGCRTAGSEVSEEGRRRLVGRGHEAIHPDELPESRFHFVNTDQVVEHLVDPRRSLEQLVAALRPGGLLRIAVPNGTNIRAALELGDWDAPKGSPGSLNAVAPLEHLNCFDAGSLERLGRVVGLEPFRYPLRQFIDPLERVRFVASAVVHRFRRPEGTLQLFRKPGR